MKSLYISDLDGTLLDQNGALSETSRQLLNQLLEKGLAFTVASGRSCASVRQVLQGLALRLPIIASDGAFLTHFHSGEHQTVRAIVPEVAQDLYALIREFDFYPFVTSFDGRTDHLFYSHILNAGMQWYLDERQSAQDKRLEKRKELRGCLDQSVICYTLIGLAAPVLELEQAVRRHFGDAFNIMCFESWYSPGWQWLRIHDRKATKAQAISALVEHSGLEDYEIVVFGDQLNDLQMMRQAHRAIAVENALEPVKALASQIIGPHSHDSVARFLCQEWAEQNAAEDAEKKRTSLG